MSMKRFGRAFAKWSYSLVGGCFGAGVHSVGVKFGLDGLHELGVAVPQFSMRQMGYIFLAGVVTHGVLYIKQTPFPPLQFDDDTIFMQKPIVGDVKPLETEVKP